MGGRGLSPRKIPYLVIRQGGRRFDTPTNTHRLMAKSTPYPFNTLWDQLKEEHKAKVRKHIDNDLTWTASLIHQFLTAHTYPTDLTVKQADILYRFLKGYTDDWTKDSLFHLLEDEFNPYAEGTPDSANDDDSHRIEVADLLK